MERDSNQNECPKQQQIGLKLNAQGFNDGGNNKCEPLQWKLKMNVKNKN